MAERAQISITGVVQGVGFRPYVHQLAVDLGLKGFVSNTASGVTIEAEGERLDEFLERLPREVPPLARITGLTVTRLPKKGYPSFTIRHSNDLPGAFTLISPDVCVCSDCMREMLDRSDRRYLYPFINCTNCGPRYSITRSVPYDRPNTTMAKFTMCPECRREYLDPNDRRFHAQPNACPVCGPSVEFRSKPGEEGVKGNAAMERCIELIARGGIVAVKGIGGFHIACDAANDEAVRTLRERKRRNNKPFGVMAPSVEAVRLFCEVNPEEQRVLESIQRPIVLLRKKLQGAEKNMLSAAVAPNNSSIGVMLPYTPLHALLFAHRSYWHGDAAAALPALVMTSGNLSEEPIVHRTRDAFDRLASFVDGFLIHDRDIFMRVDDSVVRVRTEQSPNTASGTSSGLGPLSLLFLRRSRGYVPDPIALSDDGPEVLGCGADLKNTFTLTKGAWAIPSQHIGDMENYETLGFYEETLQNLRSVYRVEPVAIVHDLHPGYLSTRWALEQAKHPAWGTGASITTFVIQHHYAHIGSVMAEKGLKSKVIGIAFDGTGYGTDGHLWGGEFMIADIDGFDRIGQLAYLSLPGGEAAIREPWRSATGLVIQAEGDEADSVLSRIGLSERHDAEDMRLVRQVLAVPELSPRASGAGRYFDALAAMLGICDRNSFEGEAAMALESLITEGVIDEYPVDYLVKNGYTNIGFTPLIHAVIQDLLNGVAQGVIAAKFHNSFLTIISTMASRINRQTGIRDVVLSGGSFQNRYLMEHAVERLMAAGLEVHVNRQVPPNDACISLGQAYLARERMKRSTVLGTGR